MTDSQAHRSRTDPKSLTHDIIHVHCINLDQDPQELRLSFVGQERFFPFNSLFRSRRFEINKLLTQHPQCLRV